MPNLAPTITPNLWFFDKAEEAARYYASILPDSRIDNVTILPGETPDGTPAGKYIEFTLCGQKFAALGDQPLDPFNHAISLMVNVDTQEEIDRYHAKLSAGGEIEPCGWVKDRYGMSWQICPRILLDMQKDKDRARAARVMAAMMKMKRLVIADLERAYRGEKVAEHV